MLSRSCFSLGLCHVSGRGVSVVAEGTLYTAVLSRSPERTLLLSSSVSLTVAEQLSHVAQLSRADVVAQLQ